MPSGVRVHIIDDDEQVLESLTFLLESEAVASRAYASAAEFLEGFDPSGAGCVVTDVKMPGMTGFELLGEIKARGSRIPVIVMTGEADASLAMQSMRGGAYHFLEKPFANRDLMDCLRRALAPRSGGTAAEERALAATRLAALSETERRVLHGWVAGQTSSAIDADLGLVAGTAEALRDSLITRMGAGSYPDLVRLAVLAGAG
jgi:two-component system response regulator FixJ